MSPFFNKTDKLIFAHPRDDLTVEVIFFGDEEAHKSGGEDVVLNAEATAPNLGAKAKL